MIKLQTDKRTVVVVSAYVPQQGLTNDEKYRFYESTIQLIASINEKDMVIFGGDLSGNVGKEVDGYDNVHRGYGFGVRNTEGKRVLEIDTALDMLVCNTWFKKRDSRLITYSSDACNPQIDYILVRNKDRKPVKDVKVIPSGEVASQHRIVVSDVKIKPCEVEKQPFIPKRRVCKFNERDVKENFANDFENVTQRVIVEDHVEGLWKSLKDDLLSVADKSCGWTKEPPRHQVTWWWNKAVDQAIKRKVTTMKRVEEKWL